MMDEEMINENNNNLNNEWIVWGEANKNDKFHVKEYSSINTRY